MTGVFIRRNLDTETDTQMEERDVKTEAEIGSLLPPPRKGKTCWKPPEARKKAKQILPHSPAYTLIPDF